MYSVFPEFNFKLFLLCLNLFHFNIVDSYDVKSNDENLVQQYRLNNNTTPINYNIHIETLIDKDNFKFSGKCIIKIRVNLDQKNEIEFHVSEKTKISKVFLNNVSLKKEISIEGVKYNNITEIFMITTKENLNINHYYDIHIEYESILREDEMGFYRSSYINDDGKKVWLAATQFAPTDARHAFPCYDEPRYKADFTLEITHSKNLKAISNTDVADKIDISDETVKTTFKTTPIMSTYLVGFVISDFDKKSLNNNEHFVHEVFIRSNALKYINFANEFGEMAYGQLMELFKNIQQPQQIGKMKQIGLPDFHFSGMENWGIVTYKESILIYNDKIHGGKVKLDQSYVMAHEMSHQWFGNLVTHQWWTYVWLKEGFATMYGYYIIDMLYPHWNIMERYQIIVMQLAFSVDSDSSIRPMTFYVEKQKDIRNNYDKIAYEKSSCVLKMFDHALGRVEGTFKNGVDIYLSKGKFKEVTEIDLFNALETASQSQKSLVNITEAIQSWTSQGGFPALIVKCNNSHIILEQQRFSFNDNKDYSLWHVPINFETENGNNFNNTSAKFWMQNRTEEFLIEDYLTSWKCEENWIIFNIQQTGYYRVNYQTSNWRHLIVVLLKNHENIHTNNRAQLIDDGFNFAKTNKMDYKVMLDLLKYFVFERDYAPWAAFDNHIDLLKMKLKQTKYYKHFKLFMQEILKPAFKFYGVINVNSELPLISMTRSIIARRSCEFELRECIENKLNYGVKDMRSVYYAERLKTKNKTVFFDVMDLLKKSEDAFVRQDYISSLGYYEDEKILTLLLWETIQDSEFELTKKEKLLLLKSIYQNTEMGLNLCLGFILRNSNYYKKNLNQNELGTVMEDIAKFVQTTKHIESFDLLLDRLDISESSAKRVKQTIFKGLQWSLYNLETVTNWLRINYVSESEETENQENASVSIKIFDKSCIFALIIFVVNNLII